MTSQRHLLATLLEEAVDHPDVETIYLRCKKRQLYIDCFNLPIFGYFWRISTHRKTRCWWWQGAVWNQAGGTWPFNGCWNRPNPRIQKPAIATADRGNSQRNGVWAYRTPAGNIWPQTWPHGLSVLRNQSVLRPYLCGFNWPGNGPIPTCPIAAKSR